MTALDDATKAKVLRQVEFYFSDSNLPKDKFLKERVAEDPEGYVKLNIIIAFQRMRDVLKIKEMEPAAVPAESIKAVAEVLAGSASLQLDESKTKVKRKAPLADEAAIARAVDSRSLYARPFPVDATVDAITDFFGGHAAVNCVRMRRHTRSKGFKGSVFVEFGSVEDSEKVLGMALEFAGAPLRMVKKVAFIEAKREARKSRAAGGKHDGDFSDDSNVEQDLPDGAGGVVDTTAVGSAAPAFANSPAKQQQQQQPKDKQQQAQKDKQQQQQKDKQERVAKRKPEEPEYDEGDLGDAPSAKRAKPAEAADAEGEGDEDMGEGEEPVEPPEPRFTPGCLLDFTLETELPELTGPQVIRDVMGGKEKVIFVELRADRKGGIMRFSTPEVAASTMSEFEGRGEDERTIAGIKGSMKVVESDEEKAFFKRAAVAAAARRAQGGRGDRGGRGGRFGRGGRGGNFRGRGRSDRGGRGGRGGGGRGRGRY